MGRDDEVRSVPRVDDGQADLDDLWNLLDARLVGLPAHTLAAIHAPPMPPKLIEAIVEKTQSQPGNLDRLHDLMVEWQIGHADALLARLAETEAPR